MSEQNQTSNVGHNENLKNISICVVYTCKKNCLQRDGLANKS